MNQIRSKEKKKGRLRPPTVTRGGCPAGGEKSTAALLKFDGSVHN
jgi:hypothetical protein